MQGPGCHGWECRCGAMNPYRSLACCQCSALAPSDEPTQQIRPPSSGRLPRPTLSPLMLGASIVGLALIIGVAWRMGYLPEEEVTTDEADAE